MDPKQLTIEQVQEILLKEKYVCDRSLATVVYLSLVMGKPLLLEGEAGVGKTEIAKVLSKVLGARLIRLQCYEGLDASTALYEWNYPKQMLHIKLEEIEHGDKKKVETEIFTQDYLVKRPLLDAIQSEDANPPVLLIDEIDRADMEFEAFLLEVLSDFQITIPEFGTVTAKHRPYVFLTSNRTREIHDALETALLVPLDRVSDLRQGIRDHHHQVSRSRNQDGAANLRLHAKGARDEFLQAARCRRNLGLGVGADRAQP